MKLLFVPAVFLLLSSNCTFAWDSDDLELFDLVEEVNENFYDTLGVTQDASTSDIRKAYRKLSLQYHPDKNKEENAETKFRQIVAIYEVLKDKDRREHYNHVLEHGLPDWKQPVYYYRKVRKLGLLEMAVLLFMIFTVGHFLVIWTSYFEKRFELEEVFKLRKKKDKKGRKAKLNSANQEEEYEEMLQKGLELVPKPRLFLDLLPIKLARGIFNLITGIPSWLQEIKQQREEMRRQKEIEEEERRQEEIAEKLEEERRSQPRKRKVIVQPEIDMCEVEQPVSYTPVQEVTVVQQKQLKSGPWDSEDDHLLAKAVAKFPGGTTERWEKIADFVGRPESVVIKKVKALKSGYVKNVDAKAQGITGELGEAVSMKKGQAISAEISTRADISLESQQQMNPDEETFNSNDPNFGLTTNKKKNKTKTSKSNERTLMISDSDPASSGDKDNDHSESQQPDSVTNSSSKNRKKVNFSDTVESVTVDSLLKNDSDNKLKVDNTELLCNGKDNGLVWSQNQQKIFEWGLSQFPKGTPERFDKVAEHIPGKTKEDCINRFKYLADLVKKKKQEKLQNTT